MCTHTTARKAPTVGSQLLKVHNITAQLTSSPGTVRAWAAPRPIAVRPDRAAKRLKSQTNQLQPTALVVGWYLSRPSWSSVSDRKLIKNHEQ